MNRSALLTRASLLSAFILMVSIAGSDCQSGSENKWKLCGNRLSDIAIMICKTHGGIYEPRDRRSGLLERALGGYDRRIRRSEHGIVEECCRNSCSYNQILQYCAQPPRKEDNINGDISELLAISRPSDAISVDEDRHSTPRPPRVGTYRRNLGDIVFLDGEDNS